MASLKVTFNNVSIPSGSSATLKVVEDPDGDGVYENSASTSMSDATTQYTLSGFDGVSGNNVKVEVTLDNSDVTTTASVFQSVTVESTSLPITIDGTSVKEVTIDGQEVTSLTMDGTTLF